jgi:CRISPR-associated protein Csy1
MTDKAIREFFEYRKEAWLKKHLKASMADVEVREKELECDAVFSLSNWLPNAASRAGQISISTHPCTFSHPSSRKNKNGYASSIIAKSEKHNDGFLRSGNLDVATDALGNAAALDVYKFLTLEMADGQNLIQHLNQDSALALSLFTLENDDEAANYQMLKQGFLAMTTATAKSVTSSKIKQVYFPLTPINIAYCADSIPNENIQYHQLSILTASGILFELRKRLDAIRFGDEIKTARDKKKTNQEHQGYKEIYELTTIAYGGTKPQNISVLNNQNGGKAHMLISMPPILKKRDVHFPQSEFFVQSLSHLQFKTQFLALHKLYRQDANNMDVRSQRDENYQSVVDRIIDKMWQIRAVATEQFNSQNSQLLAAQKTWLCDHNKDLRETSDDWLDVICDSITTFLFYGYEKTLGRKAITFGEVEHKQMRKIVLRNREALR